jgi:hypothetical protein
MAEPTAGDAENNGGRSGNRQRMAVWGGAALLLALPLVAMQFTDEVKWSAEDFVAFGTLLLLACGGYEGVTRTTRRPAWRAVGYLAVAAAFLWLWAELAVGVFTDWGS